MPAFIEQLMQFQESVFKDEQFIESKSVRENGLLVLRELHKLGFAMRDEWTDKEARPVYVKIQESSERKAVDEVAKCTGGIGPDEAMRKTFVELQNSAESKMVERMDAAKKLGKIARSIWIIHTPLIATPCVNDGTPTPHLMAEEIAKDPIRSKLTLSRTHIIRDYLKAGGVLIVAYDKARREERKPDEIAIFEQLKKDYEKQIIDFPIDIKGRQQKLNLKDPVYPEDLIGATYLIEDTQHQIFEMTNRGVQANAPRDKAKWGVWMHTRSKKVPEVNQRMALVFDFLQNAGLNQVLNEHAQKHKIDPDEFARLLSPYMSLEIDVKKGVGCKMQ